MITARPTSSKPSRKDYFQLSVPGGA